MIKFIVNYTLVLLTATSLVTAMDVGEEELPLAQNQSEENPYLDPEMLDEIYKQGDMRTRETMKALSKDSRDRFKGIDDQDPAYKKILQSAKAQFIVNNMDDLMQAIHTKARNIKINLNISNLEKGNFSFVGITPEELENIRIIELYVPDPYNKNFSRMQRELKEFFKNAPMVRKIIVPARVFIKFYKYFPQGVKTVIVTSSLHRNDDDLNIGHVRKIVSSKELPYTVQTPKTMEESMAERRRHRGLGE